MKKAVFAFGRMNPPTVGHKKLADKVASLPGDPFIFLSQTSGNKAKKPGSKGYENKDPLPFADKLAFADASFPSVTVGDSSVKTAMDAMKKLESMGYTDVTFVAGSDRVQDFEVLFDKYNGTEYNFDNIEVVSAGQRDPDSDGVDGISASKMRAAVRAGDFETFKQGAASPQIAKQMFDTLTKILKQNPMPGDNFKEEVHMSSKQMETSAELDLETDETDEEYRKRLEKEFDAMLAKSELAGAKKDGKKEDDEMIAKDKKVSEAHKKNCGCGQDPCVTYGKVEEAPIPTSEYDYDIKKYFAKVQELEDENQHGEVAEMVTRMYGTNSELMIIQGINGMHAKEGSIGPEAQKLRDKISNKYYYQLQKDATATGESVNEMDMKYLLVNMQGKVQGFTSDEKDAKEMSRRTKSTIHPIKKKISDKTLEKMNALARSPKELSDLGIIEYVVKNPNPALKDKGTFKRDRKQSNLILPGKQTRFARRSALSKMVPQMQKVLNSIREMDLDREQLHGIMSKAARLMIEIELCQKKDVVENLYSLNRDDVMKSEVLVKGVGRYSVEGLMQNISEKLEDLSNEAKQMEPFNYKNIKGKIDSGIVNIMLDSLVQAYDDIEATRRKGGAASKGIPADMFDDVQLDELVITQGNALKVLANVASRSDGKGFPIRFGDTSMIVSQQMAQTITDMYDGASDKVKKKIKSLLDTAEGFKELIAAAKKKNRLLK